MAISWASDYIMSDTSITGGPQHTQEIIRVEGGYHYEEGRKKRSWFFGCGRLKAFAKRFHYL